MNSTETFIDVDWTGGCRLTVEGDGIGIEWWDL